MMKTALEAHELSKGAGIDTCRWLKNIEAKIDRRIESKKFNLCITSLSPLSFLLKDKKLRLHIFKELQQIGYRTFYFAGAYGKPRYILIDWSRTDMTKEQQELIERKQIDKELRQMKDSLVLTEK